MKEWLLVFVYLLLIGTGGCIVLDSANRPPPVFFPNPQSQVVVEPPPLYLPPPITFHSYYDPYPYYGYDGWGYGNRFYDWGWYGGHHGHHRHGHHHGWRGHRRHW